MRQMTYARRGNLLVVVHGNQPPDPTEWAQYLGLCRALETDVAGNPERASALLFTDGGMPSSTQRQQLGELLQGRSVRTAVVTNSLVAQVVVAAADLINPRGVKAFAPPSWREAARWVGIAEADWAEVLQLARDLGSEVRDSKVPQLVPAR